MQRGSTFIALLLGILIAVWMEWPVLLHPNTLIVGGIPDAYQYTWYLGWFWHAVSQGMNPFFSHELNYPQGFGFMYNTSAIAESILFGWLVPFTSPPFVYNLVFFINLVLVVVLGQKLTQELGARTSLSLWGGAMLGLMPYLTAQLHGHMSQYVVTPILAILLLVIRVLNRQSVQLPLYGVGVGLLLAVEFYTSLELLVTFIMSVGIFFILVLLTRQGRGWLYERTLRISWRFWLPTIGISLLLAIPGLWEFWVSGGLALGGVQLHPHSGTIWAADITSPLVPEPWLWLHSAQTNRIFAYHLYGTPEEKGNYIGLALMVFAILFYRRFKGFLPRSLFWFTIIEFVLSLGNQLHFLARALPVFLPWSFFSKMPFLDSALPMRLAFYVDLGLILWMVLAFESFLQPTLGSTRFIPYKKILVGVGCLTSLALWIPTTPYAYAKVYHLPQPVLRILGSEPVAVITSDFGYDMQAIASDGYRLKVANMYGFATNYAMPRYIKSGYLHHTLGVNQWSKEILSTAHTLKQGHVVFVPFNPGGIPIPLNLQRAMEATLGKPTLQVHGCVVWTIKPAP